MDSSSLTHHRVIRITHSHLRTAATRSCRERRGRVSVAPTVLSASIARARRRSSVGKLTRTRATRVPDRGGPFAALVINLRPPAQRMCVEFPAGMQDVGESVEAAGKRELLEETGLDGSVSWVSDTFFTDSWKSSETGARWHRRRAIRRRSLNNAACSKVSRYGCGECHACKPVARQHRGTQRIPHVMCVTRSPPPSPCAHTVHCTVQCSRIGTPGRAGAPASRPSTGTGPRALHVCARHALCDAGRLQPQLIGEHLYTGF